MKPAGMKRIILTGFTGFVGKVYAALLLKHRPDVHLTLLVRSRKTQDALQRVQTIFNTNPVFRELRQQHANGDLPWLGHNITVLQADLNQPLCGLDAATIGLMKADAMVHCAGLTDFNPDPIRAVQTNLDGAVHAADLAIKLGCPMMHVSTCYVAGMVSGDMDEALQTGVSPNGTGFRPLVEAKALRLACRKDGAAKTSKARLDLGIARAERLGWPNIYTYTKGLAEHALSQMDGLDLTIVRPSIVECSQTFPFPGWNEGLNTAGPLVWLIQTSFTHLPCKSKHLFDVIPVDAVAKGMAGLTLQMVDGKTSGVYQLASSDVAPMTFERCVELTGLAHRRWVRKNKVAAKEHGLTPHLDPVPSDGAAGPLGPGRLRRWNKRFRDLLTEIEGDGLPSFVRDLAGQSLDTWTKDQKRTLIRQDRDLSRVEKMLELYKPFIEDNNYRFSTSRARAALTDGPFAFSMADINWRTYWVDVEVPGLRRWCIPAMLGEPVVHDDPPSVPLTLTEPVLQATGK